MWNSQTPGAGLTSSTSPSNWRYHSTARFSSVTGRPTVKLFILVMMVWPPFCPRERDKPRLALNNNTAGVREREETNRTRVAGHLDGIQGVLANTQNYFAEGPLASSNLVRRLLHPDRLRYFCRAIC